MSNGDRATGASFGLVLLTLATSGPLFGGLSLAVYLAMCKRKKVDPVDGALGIFGLAEDAAGGVSDVLSEVPQTIDKAVQTVKGQRPLLLSVRQQSAKVEEDAIAIKRENLLKSAVVVAPQKSGKTRYLLDDVQAFLELHPDGALYICDPNYGSSHNGEASNTWFDLPIDEFVYVEDYKCLSVIEKLSNMVDNRQQESLKAARGKKPKPEHEATLLLVDEESMINGAIDDEDGRKEFVSWVRNLVQRGHKQNIFAKFVCHDTTTATTGFPQTLFQQVDLVLLGAAAIHDKYLAACGIDKAIASDVKDLRRISERAYLTKIAGEVAVCPMPFIPEPNFTYQVDNSDPWAEKWLTDERIAQIKALPDESRMIDDIAVGVFGLSKSRCRNTNDDYVGMRQYWESELDRRSGRILES